jgi:fructose-bisphosphate aldolase class II
MNPGIFVDTILAYAGKVNFSVPFLIHGDHITVKNTTAKEIEDGRALIAAELSAGYTSFAIDASFNPIPDNARITATVRPIRERKLGLEVEVGDQVRGSESALSTVDERWTSWSARRRGVARPSRHQQRLQARKLPGGRSSSTWNGRADPRRRPRRFGVDIAQHGITGTPLHLIGRFATTASARERRHAVAEHRARGMPPT